MTENIDYFEEQRRIEEEATLAGIRRMARTMEKARAGDREGTTQPGQALIKRVVEPMTDMLRADLAARKAGKPTKGGPSLQSIKELDPELACLVATRAALSRMSRPTKLTAVARRVGEALEDELIWHRWEIINSKQAKAVRKRVNASGSSGQRRAALRGFSKAWEEKALKDTWSTYRLIGIGLRFVDYLVRTEVFVMSKIAPKMWKRKNRAAHAVSLSPRAAEWVKDMTDFLAISRPLNWPLVIPPRPWTSLAGGGFHFRETLDHPLIPRALKPLPLVRGACREQKALLAKADLSTVYAGLNAVQATAWRVNPRVYEVLVRMTEDGRGGPSLSMADPEPVPGRLPDEEAKDTTRLRQHKDNIRRVHFSNSRLVSKRFSQHRVFAAARKFVPYPALYFACNLDFRGRLYTCSDDLSPQGNDLQRGLLEFSSGDALTGTGPHWLAVHLANCYGVDKVDFSERVRWTYDHQAMIAAVAADPLVCEAWHKADGGKKAWQFLAACFAWADFMEKGPESICRVPVMLDGSCSGIQHYAALMRDEEAGRYVNLVPGTKPHDLYQRVADKTVERLRGESPWFTFGVDRKLVKRSVMVLPYGGTFLSSLEYVREAVRDRLEAAPRPPWLTEENEREQLVVLAKTVWRAMPDVVREPLNGMRWVRACVRAWAAQEPLKKFFWVSPCGFPVVPDYRQRAKPAMFPSEINGNTLAVRYEERTDMIDWPAAERSAPPNFVHSLDASHLIFSLKRAAKAGLSQLATVHDAFGTTPTRTAEFAQVLRGEFARLYSKNPFEVLVCAAVRAGVDAPELPQMGTLNPLDIARSEYLFA